MIISTLVKVIREGLYVERDKRCIDEYLNYEKSLTALLEQDKALTTTCL